MAENIFTVSKIASEFQKHKLSLSSLELRHLQRVEHVLLDTVYSHSYLKAALVEIFEQTEEHQLDQLLHACDLGDRKPTELLAEMRKLLGAKGFLFSAEEIIYGLIALKREASFRSWP